MKALYVAWQDPTTRDWIPVARLDWDGKAYRFYYTKGAKRSEKFEPFGRLSDLEAVYLAHDLFPFFSNRVISKSRPEYREYLTWLGADAASVDAMSVLSLTGGLRGTDTIELVPMPLKTPSGRYEIEFFSRGLRHFNEACVDAVARLVTGDRLRLVKDPQNEVDTYALFMRTEKPIHLVGYVPRFYAKDLGDLLARYPSDIDVRVKRVNSEAPLSMRLLCTVSAPWPDDFRPFEMEDDFAPLPGQNALDHSF